MSTQMWKDAEIFNRLTHPEWKDMGLSEVIKGIEIQSNAVSKLSSYLEPDQKLRV